MVYCIVPKCKNTKRNNPTKVFVSVPHCKDRRKKWLEAIDYRIPRSEKTHLYVCEDHFNLEDDLENYFKVKLMGYKMKMKPHVIPHKFDCRNKPSGSKTKMKNTHIQNPDKKETSAKEFINDNIDIKVEFVEVSEENISYNFNSLELKHEDVHNTEDICVKEEHFIHYELPDNSYNELFNTTECETARFTSENSNSNQLKIENQDIHKNKIGSTEQECFLNNIIDNKIEFVEVSNNSDSNFYNELLHVDSSSNKSVIINNDLLVNKQLTPAKNTVKCEYCNKNFRTKGGLKRHFKNKLQCRINRKQHNNCLNSQYVPSIAPKPLAPSQPPYHLAVNNPNIFISLDILPV